ncbi:MAG: hypothetical protein KJO35_00945 [Gammaproteobacteria bacterium]|nr:hypothetical protein [Gammaproteobacteria bacterium]
MTEQKDPLMRKVAELPSEISPTKDLWPGIAARLSDPVTVQPGKRRWPLAVAAGIALVALSSLLTWTIMQPNDSATGQLAAVLTEPVRPFVQDAELMQVRAQLTQSLENSLERFSPETRQLITSNLLEIQQGLAEIRTALEQDPNNVLLHQLLYSTYEQELSLLSEINQVAHTLPTGIET